MSYVNLAFEMWNLFPVIRRMKSQRIIDEAAHGEIFALMFIANQSGSVTPGEISRNVDVSAARIATILNNLENRGLITRQIDAKNRRSILVTITDAGKKAAAEQQETVIKNMVELLKYLGEQDAKEYVRIMRRVSEFPSQSPQPSQSPHTPHPANPPQPPQKEEE